MLGGAFVFGFFFAPAFALVFATVFASDHSSASAVEFFFEFAFALVFRPISSTREITHSWGHQHGETYRGKAFIPTRLNVSRETSGADEPDDEEVHGVIEVEEVFEGISAASAITR